ncbi:MAG: sarcosine oxidase subunit gamma family protein [Gammaproteobacteria bacterium]
MNNLRTGHTVIDAEGLSVSVDLEVLAASLRYFDSQGSFAAAVHDVIGGPLPQPLRALRADPATNHAPLTLAWRSPTETLLLCKDRQAFMQLGQRLAANADGCMVDQTGGIRVLRVRGARTEDLLTRLGANNVFPELGEARTGRLAELPVTAVRIQADEVMLLVERVYADHLLEWIAVTAGDF